MVDALKMIGSPTDSVRSFNILVSTPCWSVHVLRAWPGMPSGSVDLSLLSSRFTSAISRMSIGSFLFMYDSVAVAVTSNRV